MDLETLHGYLMALHAAEAIELVPEWSDETLVGDNGPTVGFENFAQDMGAAPVAGYTLVFFGADTYPWDHRWGARTCAYGHPDDLNGRQRGKVYQPARLRKMAKHGNADPRRSIRKHIDPDDGSLVN